MTATGVLVAGAVGSGRTTMLRTIASHGVYSTDQGALTQGKHDSELEFAEFGLVPLDEVTTLSVFVPSEAGIEAMIHAMGDTQIGTLVVVNRQDPEGLDRVRPILQRLKGGSRSLAIALNRCAGSELAVETPIARRHLGLDENVPVVLMDSSDRGSVRNALLALLFVALDGA